MLFYWQCDLQRYGMKLTYLHLKHQFFWTESNAVVIAPQLHPYSDYWSSQ